MSTKRKTSPPAKKRPRGRPSKFTEAMLKQAATLSELGLTDAKMADFFGVSESTLNNWKQSHPDFLESLKTGKAIADEKVERALYERAIGYEHPDSHVSNFQGSITVTPIVKHYPPDTTAGIFWLKNRKPEQWREKQEVAHDGKIEVEIVKKW
jgi:DNA-binding XRE family transcriptional regulator